MFLLLNDKVINVDSLEQLYVEEVIENNDKTLIYRIKAYLQGKAELEGYVSANDYLSWIQQMKKKQLGLEIYPDMNFHMGPVPNNA